MGHPGKSCLAKGGGLDMIYAGKGFSVECLFEQLDPETIIYTNNPENDYLKASTIVSRRFWTDWDQVLRHCVKMPSSTWPINTSGCPNKR